MRKTARLLRRLNGHAQRQEIHQHILSHKGVVKSLVSFGAALLAKKMLQKKVNRLFKRR